MMVRSGIQICKMRTLQLWKNDCETPEISLWLFLVIAFQMPKNIVLYVLIWWKNVISLFQCNLVWFAVMWKLALQCKTQQWIWVSKVLLDFQNKMNWKKKARDVVLRQKANCYCFLLLRISHCPILGETALHMETSDIWNSF